MSLKNLGPPFFTHTVKFKELRGRQILETLTQRTIDPFKSRCTRTRVTIQLVRACCAVQTRVGITVIDICYNITKVKRAL